MRIIVDTGIPISLIPKSFMVKQLKLTKRQVPKNREFGDLNDNTVKVVGINEVVTELWDGMPPIVSLDNFQRIRFKLICNNEGSKVNGQIGIYQ